MTSRLSYTVVAALPCACSSGMAWEVRNSGFTFGFVCQFALCDTVSEFCGFVVQLWESLYQAEQMSHYQAE